MHSAKQRLIFPLDLPEREQALRYVRLLREQVGVFKVGLELFISEGPDILNAIRGESDAGIFLDLKLHDIPATIKRALKSSMKYRPLFVTVHCDEGGGFLRDIYEDTYSETRILGITVLTSLDSNKLMRGGYSREYCEDIKSLVILKAKIALDAGCHGIVCSGHEVAGLRKELGQEPIVVTPGIRPLWSLVPGDDQKRIITPSEAIKKGTDYIVVGRPIRDSEDPAESARRVVQEIESAL